MAILLSDAGLHKHLLPLTYTRPVGALSAGIFTIAGTWERLVDMPVGFLTESYLQAKFPAVKADRVFEVHGGLLPTEALAGAVVDLEPGQVLLKHGKPLAFCLEGASHTSEGHWAVPPTFLAQVEFKGEVLVIERPWHLFQHCATAITNDFALLTEGRRSAPLSALNTVIGDPKLVFLEEGAKAEASIFNTTNGPIWIGKDAEVMEGCMIRGPFALGDNAQLKMGAKIYGACSFGPECRVGGEVNNSVILGYSNKGHDGFLGNSVLGEWCNLGADTNTSNLKNTYGEVAAWSYADETLVHTGQQFLGLVMGDHAKSGINTMFNTGTVAGVCANVFGSGFAAKHIPSFSWGESEVYALDKAFSTCARVMDRRHVPFTDEDEKILRHVFNMTEVFRR
ncbi:MAG: glucose-1-phosphate thymidylyltransferase [Flavobacteriales bacterium]|jgi:UDP-N-acetylglucosamine diphosphorylase/glucosamine-1-phosphate N-acetyltransferase|nr:glucose-1-phosphate thymidylyltransferase [Flavobacteriales bacterium]MBK9060854.1 glucose-1-phosphate thymidylyltransferase [Flavobacteriales bacterium]MBK9599004.1 glucose-1-phosphate thymidylyltransferase [Flavobacteriales bacterium]QQS73206.1 MAG: glucose-1-phosphate thymidylyltransferase [Flavobacteriales bacterium]HQV40012.1 putative sugar nucleotidyl transferase [Flavobacteriales bacterium]